MTEKYGNMELPAEVLKKMALFKHPNEKITEQNVDEEYTIDNGVTTFLSDIDHVMCVLTNAKFPNFYLYTNFIDATSGIEDVAVDGKPANADVYTLQGVLLIKDPPTSRYRPFPPASTS